MRWGEKRYHSLDWELKNRFGEKIYKITLNGGMTCPNRDGRVGTGGCIFCSAHGSGDFAGDASLSVTEQLMQGKADLQKKRPIHSYIAYFQAFTNTYAPVDYLEKIFTEAIRDPDVKILSIATRPDCLGPDVVALLARLNRIKPVWVELGLQTIHPETTKLIRRGYPLDVFDRAVNDPLPSRRNGRNDAADAGPSEPYRHTGDQAPAAPRPERDGSCRTLWIQTVPYTGYG